MTTTATLTDAEIGQALRWLSSIPIDSGLRISVYNDECEMSFGAAHRANAGWCVRVDGDTLVGALLELIGIQEKIDKWISSDHETT